jgi:hypothetical protein
MQSEEKLTAVSGRPFALLSLPGHLAAHSCAFLNVADHISLVCANKALHALEKRRNAWSFL